MLSSATALSLSSSAFSGLAAVRGTRSHGAVMETKAELEALAMELNPLVGYWDPLKLADGNFWGQGEEATIGWLRESEIKHGRLAMLAAAGWPLAELYSGEGLMREGWTNGRTPATRSYV